MVNVVCGPLVLSMLPTFGLLSTIIQLMLHGEKLQNASKFIEEVCPFTVRFPEEGSKATRFAANALIASTTTVTATPIPSTSFFRFIVLLFSLEDLSKGPDNHASR